MTDRESAPTETSRAQLLAELRHLEEQLADVEEEERAWFCQTGHHVGRRAYQARRQELAQDKENLKSRIQHIAQLLDS